MIGGIPAVDIVNVAVAVIVNAVVRNFLWIYPDVCRQVWMSHKDADINHCNALLGQDRTSCWGAFDKKLMTDVVPWVPYLWATVLTLTSPSVTKYEFDQFGGVLSLCHFAVNNGVSAASL